MLPWRTEPLLLSFSSAMLMCATSLTKNMAAPIGHLLRPVPWFCLLVLGWSSTGFANVPTGDLGALHDGRVVTVATVNHRILAVVVVDVSSVACT